VSFQVRAIDGMVEEQKRFLHCFTLCIVCTTLSLCGDFFIMMELPGAWTAAAIMFFGMIYWAHSCMRIYSRFYFSNEKDTLMVADPTNAFNDEYTNSVDAEKSPLAAHAAGTTRPTPWDDGDDDEPGASGLKYQYSANISIRQGHSNSWPRYYLVLKGKYGLYYKDKKSFESCPMEPLNNRPIQLNEYVVDVKIEKDQYALNLIPADAEDYRKTWEFRVDTEQELQNWRTEFERVCSANP
jgi:hypothetical protein